MRVDLIELLRCPANHELAPLITVADRRDGEHLLDASLGCVVCGANYLLRDGLLQLTSNDSHMRTTVAAIDVRLPVDVAADAAVDDAEEWREDSSVQHAEVVRIAALLNLTDASARVMLCGRSLGVAQAIETMTGVTTVSVNPSESARDEASATTFVDVMFMSPSARVPLGDRSLAGIAVDAHHAPLLADATRVVRLGGRVLAAVGLPMPAGCRELARDAVEWVAEVEATTSAPVGLTRSR